MDFLDCIWVSGLGIPVFEKLIGQQIVLNRNWQKDQQSIEDSVNTVLRDNIPCYILIFPEGTRITRKNIEKSNEFARERGLKELHKVVLPRVKGLHMILTAIKSQNKTSKGIRWIYDVTIGYPPTREFIECYRQEGKSSNRVRESIQQRSYPVIGVAELLMKVLRGSKVCVNVRKVAVDTVPIEDDVQFNEWCYERFYRKEDMLNELEASAKERYKTCENENLTQQELSSLYQFKGEPVLKEPFVFVPWW